MTSPSVGYIKKSWPLFYAIPVTFCMLSLSCGRQVGYDRTSPEWTQGLLMSIQVALETYRHDAGDYPSSDEGLIVLIKRPATAHKWSGPYVDRNLYDQDNVFCDSWGRAINYTYMRHGSDSGYDLISLGPDGQRSQDDIVISKKPIR
jgi:type II secretion system protein G